MIFCLICIALMISTIVIQIVTRKHRFVRDFVDSLRFGLTAVTVCACFFCATFLICGRYNPEGKRLKDEAWRNAVQWEVDNKVYGGDSVANFNRTLLSYQISHENPWTSWFVPDYIMDIKPVELND